MTLYTGEGPTLAACFLMKSEASFQKLQGLFLYSLQARASIAEDAAPRAGGPGCTVNPAVGANVNSGQNDWLSYQ